MLRCNLYIVVLTWLKGDLIMNRIKTIHTNHKKFLLFLRKLFNFIPKVPNTTLSCIYNLKNIQSLVFIFLVQSLTKYDETFNIIEVQPIKVR